MTDKTIPTFSTPPSILSTDLHLSPGESRTFEYRLTLPGDLPPTYKGRSIRFSYTLLVGVNRAPVSVLGETEQRSRLMRIPVRIYNNVSGASLLNVNDLTHAVTGARPFYDLTNPVVWYRDEATSTEVEETKEPALELVTAPRAGRAEFETYASKLLDAVFQSPTIGRGAKFFNDDFAPTPSAEYASRLDGPPELRPEMTPRNAPRPSLGHRDSNASDISASAQRGSDDLLETGCRSAVEVVTRNSAKASYDINKDGNPVATLTLVKTAFRLGETVHATVLVNNAAGRVLRVRNPFIGRLTHADGCSP